MKKIVNALLLVTVCFGLCFVLSGCGMHTCDYCKKTFWGSEYYRGIMDYEKELTACKECAESYWAPLDVDSFKK